MTLFGDARPVRRVRQKHSGSMLPAAGHWLYRPGLESLEQRLAPAGPGALAAALPLVGPGAGTYSLGVSSSGNFSYDPTTAGSGQGGKSTGSYALSIARSPFAESGITSTLQTADVVNGNAQVQGSVPVNHQ